MIHHRSHAARHRTRNRSGFTFIELLVVVGILVTLGVILVPYLMAMKEQGNRQTCLNNLYLIGQQLSAYAAANGYNLPQVRTDPDFAKGWTAFTGADDPDPFNPASAVQPNDVTASLWLLVRTTVADSDTGLARLDTRYFVCPSSNDRRDAMLDASGRLVPATMRGNFRESANLSYAYATPFAAINWYQLNSDSLPARFALLSDKPPAWPGDGPLQQAAARTPGSGSDTLTLSAWNSPNHRGAGQNVLYGDLTVRFETTPYAGVRRETGKPGDNIYTALSPEPLLTYSLPHDGVGYIGTAIGPAYTHDSYLVPPAKFTGRP